MKKNSLKKFSALLMLVAFISVSLSSCHRYGCPNQIQNDQEVSQQDTHC